MLFMIKRDLFVAPIKIKYSCNVSLVVLPIIQQVDLQERVKITKECGEIQAKLVLVRVSGELELSGFYWLIWLDREIRYPFWAEPPLIGHHRENPPPPNPTQANGKGS